MKGKRTLLIVGAAAVAAGFLICLLAFALTGFKLQSFTPVRAGERELHTETFDAASVDTIHISAETDDVVVRAADGEASLTYYTGERNGYSYSLDGGALSLKHEPFNGAPWYTFLLPNLEASSTVVLSLPRDYAGELRIATSTGGVSVSGFALQKALTLAVSTGRIDLSDVSAPSVTLSATTGRIALDTVSALNEMTVSASTGSISLNACAADTLTMSTSTGDMHMTAVSANEVSLSANTGEIFAEALDTKALKARTSTGAVRLALTGDRTLYDVDCSSNTGNIAVEGDTGGFGMPIEVETSTGNIIISFGE